MITETGSGTGKNQQQIIGLIERYFCIVCLQQDSFSSLCLENIQQMQAMNSGIPVSEDINGICFSDLLDQFLQFFIRKVFRKGMYCFFFLLQIQKQIIFSIQASRFFTQRMIIITDIILEFLHACIIELMDQFGNLPS